VQPQHVGVALQPRLEGFGGCRSMGQPLSG
jgi:hypothetical protein